MISVVIPVKDDKCNLCNALRSVEWQTVEDVEVVVVDDNSEIPIDCTSRARFKCIRSNVTLGTAGARNLAIENSDGEYILPLDSDDILIPTAAERMLSKIGQADIVYPNHVQFGTEHAGIMAGKYEKNRLKQGNFIVNSSLYKRQVWESIKSKNGTGYNEKMPAWEDWLFWIEAELLGFTFTHINEYLLLYRIRKNSRNREAELMRDHLRELVNMHIKRVYGVTLE